MYSHTLHDEMRRGFSLLGLIGWSCRNMEPEFEPSLTPGWIVAIRGESGYRYENPGIHRGPASSSRVPGEDGMMIACHFEISSRRPSISPAVHVKDNDRDGDRLKTRNLTIGMPVSPTKPRYRHPEACLKPTDDADTKPWQDAWSGNAARGAAAINVRRPYPPGVDPTAE